VKKITYPKNAPFDPVTGDLLPEYRDAYLLSQLTPVPMQQVEAYLKQSPIQRSIVLGRYHELAAKAKQSDRELVPPRWVRQQLLQQASVSTFGPLRRPVVRLALGMLLLLGGASVVQWLRNEPLVPAPVAAAMERATTATSEATQRFVKRFTAPAAKASPASAPAKRPVAAAPRPAVKALVAPTTQEVPALASRTADVAPLPADSLPQALPSALPADGAASLPTSANSSIPERTSSVHGRISDAKGRPLPGATVLVQGTRLVTSSDASGHYVLEVPAGAALEFGYGGYEDRVVSSTSAVPLNITLQRANQSSERLARKR
jgi:hypothetical protein